MFIVGALSEACGARFNTLAPTHRRIPEIVSIAVFNIHIPHRAIEARRAKDHLPFHLLSNNRPPKLPAHLLKPQLQIVIPCYESHMVSRWTNKLAQCLKEWAMSCHNLVQFCHSYRNITDSLRVIGGGCQEIKAVTIDNQFNIVGPSQWPANASRRYK